MTIENTDAPSPTLWRTNTLVLTVFSALTLFVLFTNWKAIGWLWASWTELPEFSHGPVMPFIAAFLIWQRRNQIEQTPFEGSYLGVLTVVIGGIALIAGSAGAVYTLQQYAMLTLIFGLVLAYVGSLAMREFLMPFVVLALMIPQPEFILNQMSAKLQLLSSGIGVSLIRVAGISVFLEGNVIDLGNYRLQVVDACAGLRYLFPLMTLGLLVAYFFQASIWKRWLVFFASIPITILMNSVRIATVGLMVDRWGIGMAEGFIHDFQGWVVFMLSAVILLCIAACLHLLGGTGIPWRDVFGVDIPVVVRRPKEAYTTRGIPRSAWVAGAVLCVVCVGAITIPERQSVIPRHAPFASFPLKIGRWQGASQMLGEEVVAASALDDYFFGAYQSAKGELISLYVSYYDSQRDRRVVHSPAVCLPGSGWHIVASDVVQPKGTVFVVNRIVIANGDSKALVYYWFDQRGRFVTNEWMVKWYLFRDALLTRKTYGAMVRILTPLAPRETTEHAAIRLDAFAAAAQPDLLSIIPR